MKRIRARVTFLSIAAGATLVSSGCTAPTAEAPSRRSPAALSAGSATASEAYAIRVALDADGLGATSMLVGPDGAITESQHVAIPSDQQGVSAVDNGDGTFTLAVGASTFTWAVSSWGVQGNPTAGVLSSLDGSFALTVGTSVAAPTDATATLSAGTHPAALPNLFAWVEIGIAAANAICHYYLGQLRNQCNSIGCVFTDLGSCGPPFHNQLNTDCECPPGASGYWKWPKVKVVRQDLQSNAEAGT